MLIIRLSIGSALWCSQVLPGVPLRPLAFPCGPWKFIGNHWKTMRNIEQFMNFIQKSMKSIEHSMKIIKTQWKSIKSMTTDKPTWRSATTTKRLFLKKRYHSDYLKPKQFVQQSSIVLLIYSTNWIHRHTSHSDFSEHTIKAVVTTMPFVILAAK